MKKSLAMIVVLVFLLNMFPSSVFATYLDSSPYEQVDLSNYYNLDVFAFPSETLRSDYCYFGYDSSNPPIFYANQLLSNPNFINGSYNFQNVAYKFGPIGTAEQASTANNMLRSSDVTIDLENGQYKSVNILGNNHSTVKSDVIVYVYYEGETEPVIDTKVTWFNSFRNYTEQSCEGETYVGTMAGACKRDDGFDNGTVQYPGHIYLYTVETDQSKVVDKIRIKRGNVQPNQFNIFAMSLVRFTLDDISAKVTADIGSLPALTEITVADKEKIDEIRTNINYLLENGVTVNLADFPEKEIKAVILSNAVNIPLSYSRDAFVSNGEDLTLITKGYQDNIALREDNLQNMFTNGVLYKNNIPFSFGPLGAVGNPNNQYNAIHIRDFNKKLNIQVPNNYYSSLEVVMNSTTTTQVLPATITINYSDGKSEIDEGVTGVSSFRANVPSPLAENETFIGAIGGVRQGGSYLGNMFSYSIKPSQYKKISSITIEADNVVIFSVTGIKQDALRVIPDIVQLIDELPDIDAVTIRDKEKVNLIRGLIDYIISNDVNINYISNLDSFIQAENKMNELKAQEGHFKIYVSVNGNDNNSGDEYNPIATITEARNRIRLMDRDMPIDVIIHEGTYRFDQPLTLNSTDSGIEGAEVTYKADGKVVFTSAKTIDISQFASVTDTTILNRLPVNSKSNVKQLNLTQQNIQVDNLPAYIGSSTPIGGQDVSVYFNGFPQDVAQYPNGDGNYTSWEEIVDPGEIRNSTNPQLQQGGTIKSYEDRVAKWANEPNFYLGGFFGYDYRYETSNVESVVGTNINLKYPTDFSIINAESKRFKAFHILEELESPGEWYIDRTNQILYYYPLENFNQGTMEIVYNKTDVINAVETDFVSFDGITFDKILGNAITFYTNVKNNKIVNCTFSNIGNKAITISGTTRGTVIENSYRNIIDGGSNCVIEGNKFINIGNSAISLFGGNRDTLEYGNNSILNNYLYNVSILNRNAPAIDFSGVGNVVSHNVIHHTPFHAINFFGNDNLVQYNNLFNVSREVYDAAVVYSGRNLVGRGNDISYNYIHDFFSKDKRIGYDVVGVYLDDRYSGTYIHHNIFNKGSAAMQVGGGQHNILKDNIVADCLKTFNTIDRTNEVDTSNLPLAVNNALNIPIYMSKYPELAQTAQTPYTPLGNKFINNITNSSISIDSQTASLGEVNNVSISNSAYVDYENKDFRIKSSSGVALPTTLTESFDMSQIGNQGTLALTDGEKAFEKLYPFNGQMVDDIFDLTLMWQNSIGADKYRVVIATDLQMNNVVLDRETDFNYLNIKDLTTNSNVYYWKVYAKSLQNGNEWEDSSGVYSFVNQFVLAKAQLKPSIAFDISSYCNTSYLLKEGETYTKDSYYYSGNKMLNLTALNNLFAVNKGYILKDSRMYKMPQINNENKAVYTKLYSGPCRIDVTPNYYDEITFLATSASTQNNYKVVVVYDDATEQEVIFPSISLYYSNWYNQDQKPAFNLGVVNRLTGVVDTSTNGYLFEYRINTNSSKKAVAIKFVGNATANDIQIFAITGMLTQNAVDSNGNVLVSIMINNGLDIGCNFKAIIVSGQNNEVESMLVDCTVPPEGRGEYIQFSIPQTMFNSDSLKCFLWDWDTLKPLGTVINLLD